MAAYLVVIAHVDDREAFMGGYARVAAALVTRMGGRYLLRAPGALGLEGDGLDGASVVVSQWTDMAALRAFWESEEYARIRPLREGIARCKVLALESPDAPAVGGDAAGHNRAAAIAGIVAGVMPLAPFVRKIIIRGYGILRRAFDHLGNAGKSTFSRMRAVARLRQG